LPTGDKPQATDDPLTGSGANSEADSPAVPATAPLSVLAGPLSPRGLLTPAEGSGSGIAASSTVSPTAP
jgi:hypothetical protein